MCMCVCVCVCVCLEGDVCGCVCLSLCNWMSLAEVVMITSVRNCIIMMML